MEKIKSMLNNPIVSILDVRNPMEFEMERIEESINIPLGELMNRIEEVKKLPKPIIIHCLSGGRSAAAVNLLIQAGIEDVYNGGGLDTMKNMMYGKV